MIRKMEYVVSGWEHEYERGGPVTFKAPVLINVVVTSNDDEAQEVANRIEALLYYHSNLFVDSVINPVEDE